MGADPEARDVDWDDALPWLVLLTLAAIALALRSMVVQRRLRARIDALTDKLAMLDHRVFRINERLEAGGQGLAPSPDAPPAIEVTPEQMSEPVASEPSASEPLVPSWLPPLLHRRYPRLRPVTCATASSSASSRTGWSGLAG
jgi:hypothetical protein